MVSVGLAESRPKSSSVDKKQDQPSDLVAHYSQLQAMLFSEEERLLNATGIIRKDIETHVALLRNQLRSLEAENSHVIPPDPLGTKALDTGKSSSSSAPMRRKQLTVPREGKLASGLKNHWYAVEFSSRIDKDTLCPLELFEKAWVLFRDSSGQVACIQDECAHRACPLSLGRVIEGKVQCAYHGWEYEGHGRCVHMPSCRHTQASVKSLACVEEDGLIWVWPGDEPPAPLSNPKSSIPEGFKIHAEIVMDLPVEHGLLMENLLDLAHAPFTHTGTFAKGWIPPEIVRFATPSKIPLSGHWDPYPIQMSFEPPCYVLSTIGLRGQDCGKHLHQLHCCIPSGPGQTRLLYRLALDFWDWVRFLPGKDWFWQRMARKVIGEDLRLVVGQQNRILTGGDVWQTPVGYDKLAVRYRRWRNQVEENSPEWHASSGSMQDTHP